jgi:hypothetical protein
MGLKMAGYSTSSPPPSKPFLLVCTISLLIHAATIVALCAAIQPLSPGASGSRLDSMGIVLNSSNSAGAFTDVETQNITQAVAVGDDLVAPVLLAAATTEPNEPANDKGESSKSSNASAGTSVTAKSNTKKTGAAQKKSSRPQSTGNRFVPLASSNYAKTSVFGVEGKGSKFIYVFDRSASMEGAPLTAAKKQLLESLGSLDTVQQFHMIFFNEKTQAFDLTGGGRRIAFASDRNKKLAANFVGGITADGGTDRFVALREAINFAPDVIFFLTDADGPMSPSELAAIARANRKVQATICVIEFGTKPAPTPNNFLARIAQESGGQYGYVDTTKLPVGQTSLSAKPTKK